MHLKVLQKSNSKNSNWISNVNVNKIIEGSRTLPQNTSETVVSETKIPGERYISSEERQRILEDLGII